MVLLGATRRWYGRAVDPATTHNQLTDSLPNYCWRCAQRRCRWRRRRPQTRATQRVVIGFIEIVTTIIGIGISIGITVVSDVALTVLLVHALECECFSPR